MKRRNFIKTTIIGSLALGFVGCTKTNTTHIITLSFDDGFKKSFYKIADIYEDYSLKACFNVIVSGHMPSFNIPDTYQNVERGNFEDWNMLQSRGHEIMPHTWEHLRLTELPLEEAKEQIIKCLDYFEANLDGFNPKNAVFNYAFNASNPELDDFTLSKVRAVRTDGDPVNPFPSSSDPVRITCRSYGPDNGDAQVEQKINEFLAGPGGWLVLNTHGLDDEGWGPISSTYLRALLKRLVEIDFLEVLPAREVLKRTS